MNYHSLKFKMILLCGFLLVNESCLSSDWRKEVDTSSIDRFMLKNLCITHNFGLAIGIGGIAAQVTPVAYFIPPICMVGVAGSLYLHVALQLNKRNCLLQGAIEQKLISKKEVVSWRKQEKYHRDMFDIAGF